MYKSVLAFSLALILSAPIPVSAQSKQADHQPNESTGGTVMQPQGRTGPIVTKSGGAPASSPQGDTPPGMQPAPKGSSKKIKTDQSGTSNANPKN
ncbi:MAG: hypothetical protein JOZ11_05820 [Alphaproteobacteria bacterium]|jgi:ABC-type uncharacterized transport system involved in gliding motility auxiliary subunit|nr:hypothetical protein [Alphaproteobacteria bacterium]